MPSEVLEARQLVAVGGEKQEGRGLILKSRARAPCVQQAEAVLLLFEQRVQFCIMAHTIASTKTQKCIGPLR